MLYANPGSSRMPELPDNVPATRPGAGSTMREALQEWPHGAVLHDPKCGFEWTPARFSSDTWRAEGAYLGEDTGGRGTVVFVRAGNQEWAIRHYRRGGLAARFSEDRFIWTGRDRTRSFREWHLLRHLSALGLPVPAPVAAACWRDGWRYTADLVTQRIPGAQPLSARLALAPISESVWAALGACVGRFHDAGVCHADLNAGNLLLDTGDHPWLIDFDRGRLRIPGEWRQRNLARLLRSLNKITSKRPGLHFSARDWQSFVAGYHGRP